MLVRVFLGLLPEGRGCGLRPREGRRDAHEAAGLIRVHPAVHRELRGAPEEANEWMT